jgi:two-component sensor histidine kinase
VIELSAPIVVQHMRLDTRDLATVAFPTTRRATPRLRLARQLGFGVERMNAMEAEQCARARQDLLVRELEHRTKNLLSVVQAIVARSFANKSTVEEAKTAVMDRLQSLAHTQAILIDKGWQGADLAEVVRTEMGPYTDRVY